ncbi:hypothetical protein K435DRAFT_806500 [Dendrothele bispora CBS 962.96]|uniref:Uncharacterized protein n=1 Tax=Dendrothele bispora (strain CBS 962.96) TaxID=1314807 RepID=A0A4S8L8Z9_DENBC|nr:hypothetical protein K435DRAFT_806500 [Dendrothele bispora CBS 962.96]
MSDPDYSQLIVYNLPFTFFTLLYGVYLVLFVTCIFSRCSLSGHFKVSIYVESHFICTQIQQKTSIIADVILMLQGLGSKKKGLLYLLYSYRSLTMAHESLRSSTLTVPATMARIMAVNKYAFKSFLTVNFCTNLVLPFMIAGRIWWIENQVSKFLPSRKFNLPKHTIAICLESGIMYPLALLSALVSTFQPAEKPASQVHFVPILIQVVGIAPTFIILSIFN